MSIILSTFFKIVHIAMKYIWSFDGTGVRENLSKGHKNSHSIMCSEV